MGEDIKTNFYMGVEAAEEEEKAPGGLSGRGLRIWGFVFLLFFPVLAFVPSMIPNMLFFPVSVMCMCISESRVFLIKRPLSPVPGPLHGAAIPPYAPCQT